MNLKKTGPPRRKNDRYLKDIFEQNFADFVKFVFPNADQRFDLSKEIEFLDKEFPAPGSERGDGVGNRVVDLLAKVHTHKGEEKWILVHTEIEGGHSADLPYRIFDYWCRIRKKHKREVETVVFFTGGERQPKPSAFEAGTETTDVRFRYQTCDIHGFPETELMAMENPFSIVILACRASLLEGKVPDSELNRVRIDIAKKMLKRGYGKERTERFLYFLKNIIHTSDPEETEKYMREIGTLTEKTIDMNTLELARMHGREDGIEEGIEKGIEKGFNEAQKKADEKIRSIALNLKNMGMSPSDIFKAVGLNIKEIEKL